MIIGILKNITKYIFIAAVICHIFTKPVMSRNYENYEEWLTPFLKEIEIGIKKS